MVLGLVVMVVPGLVVMVVPGLVVIDGTRDSCGGVYQG